MRIALAVLVSASICAQARADTHPTAAVSWVSLPGAGGCGSATAFARDVERRLGRPEIASLAAGDISIEVRIDRSGDPLFWHALVEQRDARGALLGTRQIESGASQCDELRESVVLIVALMIDPDAVATARRAVAPAPVVAERTQAVVNAAGEAPRPAESEVLDAWRASFGADIAVGYGLLPVASFGVVAAVEVEPPHFWSFEGYGAVWAPQEVSSPEGTSTRFTLAYGGLVTCPFRIRDGRGEALRICAGAQVGSLHGVGEGFAVSRSGSVVVPDAVAAGRYVVPVAGALALLGGVAIYVPLRPGRFVYDAASGVQEETYRQSPVGAAADLGLAVLLP